MLDRSKLDDRTYAVLFLLDIQENQCMIAGTKRWEGYTQLQRVIEYLANTD